MKIAGRKQKQKAIDWWYNKYVKLKFSNLSILKNDDLKKNIIQRKYGRHEKQWKKEEKKKHERKKKERAGF